MGFLHYALAWPPPGPCFSTRRAHPKQTENPRSDPPVAQTAPRAVATTHCCHSEQRPFIPLAAIPWVWLSGPRADRIARCVVVSLQNWPSGPWCALHCPSTTRTTFVGYEKWPGLFSNTFPYISIPSRPESFICGCFFFFFLSLLTCKTPQRHLSPLLLLSFNRLVS